MHDTKNIFSINNSDYEEPDETIQPSLLFLLFQNRLPRWLSHDIPPLRAFSQSIIRLLECHCEQLPSTRELSIKTYFDGIEAITRKLYPLLFLGIWGYDQYNYWLHSQNRYLMTLPDLLLGIPRNYHYEHAAFATNLGGDIASFSRWDYWPWTWVVISALLSGYLFKVLSRQNPAFHQIDEKDIRTGLTRFKEDFIESFPYVTSQYWQIYRWKHQLIQKNYRLEQKEFQSLNVVKTRKSITALYQPLGGTDRDFSNILESDSDPELDIDTKNELEKILTSVTHRSYFARWLAIQALRDIAYWRSEDKMGQDATKQLSNLAGYNPYVHYQLWSSGHSKNILAHFMGYFLVTPVQSFLRLRLWALLVTKIIGWINFLQDQQQCRREEKIWRYVSEIGRYDCTVCDDDFVDYRRSLEGQGCVDALLSSFRDVEQIYSRLTSLQPHGPFTMLDFSHQNWTNWPIQSWQNVIGLLNASAFYPVTLLNLSRPIADVFPVDPGYLDSLADYLPSSNIRSLDLSGVQLTVKNTQQLIPTLTNNTRLQTLSFARSGLTDQALAPLIAGISGITGLRSWILAGNSLTGLTLNQLHNIYRTLTYLDVSDNVLTTADIDNFSLNRMALKTLLLSGADLSSGSLNNFIASLSNSSLCTLIMDNCSISDSLASSLFPGMARSPLQNLSWAGNQIGSQGLSRIAGLLNVSRLLSLNLNDNKIFDSALTLLAASLTGNSSLQELSLSGNSFTISGFEKLASSLNHSSLRSLSVSQVNLGDSTATVLSRIPNRNFSLTHLDISNTAMTVAGAAVLLPYLANTSLTDLDLHDNYFNGDITVALQALISGPLTRLNLRATSITSQSLLSVWPLLVNSSLQELDISKNRLGDTATHLAENLMTLAPNSGEVLNSLAEDIDFNRAASRASAATMLQTLIWEDDDTLTGLSGHALCLVASSTNITNTRLSLSGSHLNPMDSRIRGCPLTQSEAKFNSAATHSLSSSSLLLMVCAALLLQSSSSSSHLLVGLSAVLFGWMGGIPGVMIGAAAAYRAAQWFNPPVSSSARFFYGIPSSRKSRQTDASFSISKLTNTRSCS